MKKKKPIPTSSPPTIGAHPRPRRPTHIPQRKTNKIMEIKNKKKGFIPKVSDSFKSSFADLGVQIENDGYSFIEQDGIQKLGGFRCWVGWVFIF
jgi:hypothetical protein